MRARAAAAGVPLEEISVGATPTLRFSAGEPGLTELRPGNYVYFDRTQVGLGSAALEDCALTVLATVVSKPRPTASSSIAAARRCRAIRRRQPGLRRGAHGDGSAIDEALTIERLSEEHATVTVRGRTPLEPGDRVRVLPNHSCVVTNLVDEIRLVEGDRVTETLPVAARGRIT